MRVRRHDGIHIDAGFEVVADARRPRGDVAIVSHAHADHTPTSTDGTVVASTSTAEIAAARTGRSFDVVEGTDRVELVPAGHVVGSRAAIVEGTDGRQYCYTGDFSTRDRAHLSGFDPSAIDADVLVMETTYGDPNYRFPPQEALEGSIRDWIADNRDRPLLLFGYSLGRAQKLQRLAMDATGARPFVTEPVAAVNTAIEAATDLSFPARVYDPSGQGDAGDTDARVESTGNDEVVTDLEAGDVLVLPGSPRRTSWVRRLVDRNGALSAGFSGWAIEESYRFRGGYDETFPLTDHCDFDELVETVRTIDPEAVYTHHGFAERFADYLETRLGYRARPLLRDQSTLEDFE